MWKGLGAWGAVERACAWRGLGARIVKMMKKKKEKRNFRAQTTNSVVWAAVVHVSAARESRAQGIIVVVAAV